MQITVIGAGTMGSAIAQAFAQSGFQVRLHDVSSEAITRGLDRVRGPLEKRVAAGKMPQSALDMTMANLQPEPDFVKASQADLVIEAVFEDLGVKKELFGRLDAACPAATVLATNTSSLRVRDLAEATDRPDRVVGLHFFFPANINKLVEVVRGPQTSSQAFDAVMDVARRAGKVPIETADSPGFAVNRFFVPWINEACRIHGEGTSIATIEASAKKAFGIGMGPFELMNVTGVPISLHAQTTLHEHFGDAYMPAATLRAQVEAKADWDLAGEPDVDEKVAARLRGVVYKITLDLVDEGVATPRDTDKGATVGLRWAKGPFAMMNDDLAAAAKDIQTAGLDVPKALSLRVKNKDPFPLPDVRVTFEDAVALITFDRPDALNALNAKVLADLDACLDQTEAAKVRAVVLTGEGRAFVAGADIPTMKAMDVDGATAYTEAGNRVLDRLASLSCPVLMALNGHTLGGGLELALCGDLLYASQKATLGLPEVGLGIHPGFGGTQRLPRRIGMGAAKELVFTGRTIDADEAHRLGLVNAVLPADRLLSYVMETARTIAAKAPLAVAGAKRSMGQAFAGLDQGMAAERESVVTLFATADKDEGLGAFLERRRPRFTGA